MERSEKRFYAHAPKHAAGAIQTLYNSRSKLACGAATQPRSLYWQLSLESAAWDGITTCTIGSAVGHINQRRRKKSIVYETTRLYKVSQLHPRGVAGGLFGSLATSLFLLVVTDTGPAETRTDFKPGRRRQLDGDLAAPRRSTCLMLEPLEPCHLPSGRLRLLKPL